MSNTEVQSVAPDQATLKRSIQMKALLPKKKFDVKIGDEVQQLGAHEYVAATKKTLVLGQIVCAIYEVRTKNFEVPQTGEKRSAPLAYGDFQAVNYETGEVTESTSAFLPSYYLEAAQAIMEKADDRRGIMGAFEVVLVPTGKNIPTAYELRNLIQRRADSPIENIKRQLEADKRLRLPAPKAVEGEGAVPELPAPSEDEIPDDAGGDTPPAETPPAETPPASDGDKAKGKAAKS